MSTPLAFDFSVDKENKVITVQREFAAELPLVWDAYTKSDLLDHWWAPKPWKARTKTMDFREGGHWHYAMIGPEGEEQWSLVQFGFILPQKQFTGRDAFADAAGNVNTDMPRSDWQVTFTSKGEKTLVESRITFDDLNQLESLLQMGFQDGLTTAMNGLDELLASQK